ncbi:MAG: hypothetical protein K2X57_12035 [Xanthobacteraceae bacterium]|nr:hypothetical protein [Xanthobacteraceae bacterium]
MIKMTFLRNVLKFDAIGEGRMMFIRLIHIFAIGLVALLFFSNQIFARGGLATNTWNPAHLENLPPEIRAHVQRWEGACGGPIAAAQQFALYLAIPGTQFVALHYDDFQCRNKSVHCNVDGCLHEVYVATKGPYRRVLTIHAHDIRLLLDQNVALVEISDRSNGRTRILRWNGSRFVG